MGRANCLSTSFRYTSPRPATACDRQRARPASARRPRRRAGAPSRGRRRGRVSVKQAPSRAAGLARRHAAGASRGPPRQTAPAVRSSPSLRSLQRRLRRLVRSTGASWRRVPGRVPLGYWAGTFRGPAEQALGAEVCCQRPSCPLAATTRLPSRAPASSSKLDALPNG